MIKLVFCLAFVSMILGEKYAGFVKSVGVEKEYYASLVKLTFGQAQASCKIHGWNLVMEQKPEDTQALNEALARFKGAQKDYFIGAYLYDNDSDPLWMWLNVGDVMEYRNWEGEESTDSGHCVVKTTEGDVPGKWRAVECLEKHHYICQA